MRFIGVDVHNTNFMVCFLSEDDKAQTETFTLDHQGLSGFKRRLDKDDLLAVEACANTFYLRRPYSEKILRNASSSESFDGGPCQPAVATKNAEGQATTFVSGAEAEWEGSADGVVL
jgi:hypothetical protein